MARHGLGILSYCRRLACWDAAWRCATASKAACTPLVLLIGLLAFAACTAPTDSPSGSGASKSVAAEAAPPVTTPKARRGHSRARRGPKLTAEQRVALLKTRQSEATEKYAVRYVGSDNTKARRAGARRAVYEASNVFRANRAEFHEAGVRLARVGDEADSGLDVRLVRWGRGTTLATPKAAPSPRAEGNRVSYSRGSGLTEWYLNGPAGVEQGFTLSERPDGAGELVFEVALEGLGVTPQLTRDGKAVELMTSPQVSIGRYGELFAEDATGKLLSATMSVADGKVQLRVDDASAQYPVTVDPTVWLVEAKLVAMVPSERGPDGAEEDYFGSSVSVSEDTMVVGAPQDDDQGYYSGSAYVYVRSGSTWTVQQKLLAQLPDGTSDGMRYAYFGSSVSLSGDTLVVGADGDDDQGESSGSAYVYVRRGSTWTVQQKLLAQLPDGTPDGADSGLFGDSVSLSGDTLVVGAPYDDDQGYYSGSAYVYVRSGSTWTVQQKLLAQLPDGTSDGMRYAYFGSSVSLSGDTLVVGADGDDDQGEHSGSAYVYVRRGSRWTVQQKLLAQLPDGTPDGAEYAHFGSSVSLSGDTLVVGADGDDDQGSGSGSAYVYVGRGSRWTVQQKLLAQLPDGTSDGEAGDEFGSSVSLSEDTLVVGALYDDDRGDDSGSAYVYVGRGSTWTVQEKLLAQLPDGTPDGAADDYFGSSVSLFGDTLVVGAWYDDDQGSGSGSAYVYVRSGSTWTVQQKLLAQLPDGTPDGSASHYFGHSVSVFGDTLVVGAPNDYGQGIVSGSAYVYVRSGSTWTVQQKLYGNPSGAEHDEFGSSVSLSGDTLVVGATHDAPHGIVTGSAFVYVRSGSTWTVQQLLLAQLPDGTPDAWADDHFGSSVSLSGDTLVVGALSRFDMGYESGRAYVYVRSGSTWSVQQKLVAQLPDGTPSDAEYFGRSVSLSGDTLVVGVPWDDDHGYESGSAYVYVRSGSTWSVQQKLVAQLPDGTSDGRGYDIFGSSVSLSGDALVVGAPDDGDQGIISGSAYVYVRSGSTWTVQQKLLAQLPDGTSDGAVGDGFGLSVSLSGDTLVVGAPDDDDQGGGSGSAYVFRLRGDERGGAPCTTHLACASGSCLDGVCCAGACEGPCRSCSAAETGYVDGTCAPRAAGTRCGPDPLSCASTQSYALASRCDGAGTCVPQSATCSDGFACVMTGDYGVCVHECHTHADCADAFWCQSGGSCTADLPGGRGCVDAEQCISRECVNGLCRGSRGDACSGSAECAGNSPCVDGVCCNDVCDGPCEACNEPGAAGTCTMLGAGEQPRPGHGDCAGEVDACAGACGGRERDQCTYPSGVPCGESSCSGAQLTGQLCTADGACQAGVAATCPGNLVCGSATECLGACSSHNHCVAGSYCEFAAGRCSGVLTNGEGCDEDSQCRSGICADGVCCNTDCSDPCEACNEPGNLGVCVTLPSGEQPRPGHGSCSSAVEACAGACDGSSRSECRYPTGAPCGAASCSAGQLTGQLCTADGACQAGASAPCPGNLTCASATECLTACSSHEQCAAGSYCDFASGECRGVFANGHSCENDGECSSGNCADGVCCNTDCSDPCEACNEPGSVGVCVAVAAGEQPRPGHGSCAAPVEACAGACDGSSRSECRYPTGAPCGAANCSAGQITGQLCTADGACQAGASAPCPGNLTCASATECLTACSSHEHCAAGGYCDFANGECRGVFANGHSCENEGECSSGNCADGVCCNTDCSDPCEACNEPGNLGVCVALASGEQPRPGHGSCSPAVTACAGACDGSSRSECRYPTGAPCGAASCSAGQITGQLCTADGVCQAGASAPCAGNLACASATECLAACSSHEHCAVGSYCDFASGECRGVLVNGHPCENDGECSSGNCADGVCCNTKCNDQCEACAEPGSEGLCVPISGEPRGERPACAGDGTVCNSSCNGTERGGCHFPDAGTACASASCTGAMLLGARTCDGAGLCRAAVTQDCGLYACDAEAAACRTECSSSADCTGGASCDLSQGRCAIASTVCTDPYTVEFGDGTTTTCHPYECQAGVCRESCDSAANCADGYVCAGNRCVREEETPDEAVEAPAATGGATGPGGTSWGGSGGARDVEPTSAGGAAGVPDATPEAGTAGFSRGGAPEEAAGAAGTDDSDAKDDSASAGVTGDGGNPAATLAGAAGVAGQSGATSKGGKSHDDGGCGCVAVGQAPRRGGIPTGALVLAGLLAAAQFRRRSGGLRVLNNVAGPVVQGRW